MRYIYSMPVERIIKYFADNGFTLRKATANKLIARSADVLENFYKAICQVVLQQDYVSADETYHKVLLAKTKPTDKGSKKGYLWALVMMIGVVEVLKVTQQIIEANRMASPNAAFGLYGTVFVLYFLACWPISMLAGHLEKKWSN